MQLPQPTDTHERAARELDGQALADTPPKLLLPGGAELYFDAWVRHATAELCIADLDAYPKGTGAGSRLLPVLRDIARADELALRVIDVTNPAFFARFDWLEPQPPGVHVDGRPTVDYLAR